MYHSVGASDPLTPAEINRRLNDGLPESLEDWIPYSGVTALKIKLNGGDLPADINRGTPIDRVNIPAQANRGDPDAIDAGQPIDVPRHKDRQSTPLNPTHPDITLAAF